MTLIAASSFRGALVLAAMFAMHLASANCTLVSGNPAVTPDSRFAIAGVGAVLDTRTGLTWRQLTTSGLSWDAAVAAANADTTAGFTDWRLPLREELLTIVETGCILPALNTTIFGPLGPISGAWTATNGRGPTAWYVHFGYGYDYYEGKSTAFAARFVRGGTSILFADGFE